MIVTAKVVKMINSLHNITKIKKLLWKTSPKPSRKAVFAKIPIAWKNTAFVIKMEENALTFVNAPIVTIF